MNQENTVRMRTSTNQETEKMETTLAALAHRDYANHSVDSVDIVSVALQFEARGCGLFPRPSVGGVHGSHGHRIELSGAMPVGKPTEQRSTGFSVKFSDAYRRKFLKSNFRQYGQMKSRDGKSQRREGKKKEDQKRESLRRKKIQVREKVGKSWKVTKHCFSNDLWFWRVEK